MINARDGRTPGWLCTSTVGYWSTVAKVEARNHPDKDPSIDRPHLEHESSKNSGGITSYGTNLFLPFAEIDSKLRDRFCVSMTSILELNDKAVKSPCSSGGVVDSALKIWAISCRCTYFDGTASQAVPG